jgi:hypothetical protein
MAGNGRLGSKPFVVSPGEVFFEPDVESAERKASHQIEDGRGCFCRLRTAADKGVLHFILAVYPH